MTFKEHRDLIKLYRSQRWSYQEEIPGGTGNIVFYNIHCSIPQSVQDDFAFKLIISIIDASNIIIKIYAYTTRLPIDPDFYEKECIDRCSRDGYYSGCLPTAVRDRIIYLNKFNEKIHTLRNFS